VNDARSFSGLTQSLGELGEFTFAAHAKQVTWTVCDRLVWQSITRIGQSDGSDEAVTDPPDGLDEARPLRSILEQNPQFANALLGAVLIAVLLAPNQIAQISGADDLAGATDQQPEHLQGLGPERERDRASPERAVGHIELVRNLDARRLIAGWQIA
jgi:hypothetical protein